MIKYVVYLPHDGYCRFASSSKSRTVDEPEDATLYSTENLAKKRLQEDRIYINGLPYRGDQLEIHEIDFQHTWLKGV
jgi:hypothetical protein